MPAALSFAVTPAEQAFLLADSGACGMVKTPELWLPLRARTTGEHSKIE